MKRFMEILGFFLTKSFQNPNFFSLANPKNPPKIFKKKTPHFKHLLLVVRVQGSSAKRKRKNYEKLANFLYKFIKILIFSRHVGPQKPLKQDKQIRNPFCSKKMPIMHKNEQKQSMTNPKILADLMINLKFNPIVEIFFGFILSLICPISLLM